MPRSKGDISKWKKYQVQRLWGRSTCALFEELSEGLTGWTIISGGEDRFEMKLGKWTGCGKQFILYLICKGKLFDRSDIIWVLKRSL